MAKLFNEFGVVVDHDDSKPCDLCGHYDDNKAAKGVHPALIMLQAFGGVLAAIALAIVNLYILPVGTWDYQETAFVAVAIMLPSIALLVILFGLQVLGLHDQWIRIVIWIIGSSIVMFLLMWLIDELVVLPAISVDGGVS